MTTSTRYVVSLIATVCDNEGPTDKCVEVLEGAVVDYGGNVLGRFTTGRGASRIQNRFRIPTRLRVVKCGRVVSFEAHHPDYTTDCGYVMAADAGL